MPGSTTGRSLAADLAAMKPGQTSGPAPVAWWDFAKGSRDQMGSFAHCELKGNAMIEGGRLHLKGDGDCLKCVRTWTPLNKIEFRPKVGVFGDPIPFYWQGRYHIFYDEGGMGTVSWQHIVSENLVDWKQLPTAIPVDGPYDSWDGRHIFTGSIVEHGGRFYAFYLGHNDGNPQGLSGIRLAVSDDLVTWKKQPDFLIVADGKIYKSPSGDFGDPHVFKREDRDEWWMVLFAMKPDKSHAVGICTSTDLLTWTPQPPLDAPEGQECPDLFKIADTYYLLGGHRYLFGKDLRGKFTAPFNNVLDRPGFYAGKRLFDGKRHVWFGWIHATTDLHDSGKLDWGGTMASPRELVPGPDGVLYVRPVKEVIDAYSKSVLTLGSAKPRFDPGQWKSNDDGQLENASAPARVTFDVPEEGMVEMALKLSADADFTITFRTDEAGKQEGYAFTITPSAATVVTHGQKANWKREKLSSRRDQTDHRARDPHWAEHRVLP